MKLSDEGSNSETVRPLPSMSSTSIHAVFSNSKLPKKARVLRTVETKRSPSEEAERPSPVRNSENKHENDVIKQSNTERTDFFDDTTCAELFDILEENNSIAPIITGVWFSGENIDQRWKRNARRRVLVSSTEARVAEDVVIVRTVLTTWLNGTIEKDNQLKPKFMEVFDDAKGTSLQTGNSQDVKVKETIPVPTISNQPLLP
ncbi:uncharacterized protein BT62DRAFT_1070917 [Guyanagaster necrorhizus]|uniref:Uncharacterized protein n=1 Tax=Guyanagaster necrorhizus TaxID=856835 RepID=A0A9P7W6B4_9AGAR|nr:uncharacterized protein BT62DRAFT_1070917 [Guyanagaster necrorhizus MCA 3950]KAG7453280.1 hypothetical protein BT62DRAFT_1070917 [Guyanagaster necrorhizus MCA 3950]